jgi:hypothetical protein
MYPIYTKLNLEQYITKVSNQSDVLQHSTIISDNCKKQLTETYALQIEIASTELEFLKAKEIEVSYELVGSQTTI